MLYLKYISFVLLPLLSFIKLGDGAKEDETFVIGLLPNPVYERANVTWPIPPPVFNDLQNLKVIIKNFGDTADDVRFQTFLSDYAEMTSFTMHTDGIAYTGQKIGHKEAEAVLEKARQGNHVAAMHSPERLRDVSNMQLQTAKNTVHIKSNKEITFNIEYKETLQDMINSGVKVQNRAQVVFDLYGSTVQDLVGEIFSPNYPHPYPNSADIAWLVRVPDDKVAQLYIVDIDIEECCDRLTIYDGNSFHGPVIAILSGTLANQNNLTMYQSTASSISLHLTSDCSESKTGFRAITSVAVIGPTTEKPPVGETTPGVIIDTTEFVNNTFETTTLSGITTDTTYPVVNTSCSYGERVVAELGKSYNLSSPNYPNNYYNNANCSWWIVVPDVSIQSLSVEILDLDLENGFDYILFYDNLNLVANFTGSTYPERLIFFTYFTIHFVTDSSVTGRGFNIQYEVVLIPNCNETQHLSADTLYNNIASFDYPYYYVNNMYCTWIIHSPYSGNVIEVYLADLSVDTCCDFLVFFDGPSFYQKQISYAFEVGSYIYSTESDMLVRFTSDISNTGRGFQLIYRSVYKSNQTIPSYGDPSSNNSTVACTSGLYLTVDPYTYTYISSPNYPNDYENSMLCNWYVEVASPGFGVLLQVNDARLARSDDVYFYDGWDSYETLGFIERHLDYPSKYLANTGQMKLTFRSDYSEVKNGFLFLMKAAPIETACTEGEILNIYSGSEFFTSPNYPERYYSNMRCTWTIHSHSSYHIKLDVLNMELSDDDYIDVYAGPSTYYPFLARYTMDDYQSPLYACCSMFIVFHAHSNFPNIGFQFQYSTTDNYPSPPYDFNCSLIHHENATANGTITSYSYPSDYSSNFNECWLLDGHYNDIVLDFTDFSTEMNADVLTLYSDDKTVETFSGSFPSGRRYQRTGYDLWLRFSTNSNVTDKGFSVNYFLSVKKDDSPV